MNPSPPLSRAQRLAALPERVDLLVIGGGITGAGIALEAARRCVSVLLVEARDFAWGTSSRSSKLVHGGLRYLKEGKPGLTAESVRERDQLLRESPGLVDRIGFVFANHAGARPGKWTMQIGLAVYDTIARRRSSRWTNAAGALRLAPGLQTRGLLGASLYDDARTDDARLVLRVLADAQAAGATAINYLRAETLLRNDRGEVIGAELRAADQSEPLRVQAGCVIAATGAWADQLRGTLGAKPTLRPLRGSHLLLPAWRLPLASAVAFMHPSDGRPVFAYPWEGCTIVGTTDLDHADLEQEPSITGAEVDYLLSALDHAFPALGARRADVLSTWAGVRPVIDSGRGLAPSQESRDHLVLDEQGLITVTGGKLTTFRRIAQDTLRRAAGRLPSLRAADDENILTPAPNALAAAEQRLPDLSAGQRQRLAGRYGQSLPALLSMTNDADLSPVPGCPADAATLWAELRWTLEQEQVLHLDDLLLRRTRLGLTMRDGAAELLPALQALVCQALGWRAATWSDEVQAYRDLIRRCHALPETAP